LADDIKQDMSFAEDQRAVFVTTKGFAPEMELAVAQRKTDPLISNRLEVRSEGDWYKARIIDARGAAYRVHYFGFEDSDDEWVTRRLFRMPTVASARNSRRASSWDTSEYRNEADEFRTGTNVEVNWQGRWYPAKILKDQQGRHLVHYSGYDDSWNEWVSDHRIRRPAWNN
jgi:hypothetical protein